MAAENSTSVNSIASTLLTNPTLPINLVAITSSQLPLKLTTINYPSWKAHVDAMLFGYDLIGYIDGSLPCPPPTIDHNGSKSPNLAYTFWMRRDKLLFLAIIGALSDSIIPRVSSEKTSSEVLAKLEGLYANKSTTRIMGLQETLMKLSRGSSSVADYLGSINTITDDLALAGAPLDNIKLVIHALNGLGPEFKEIAAAIRARDTVISFEELHDKLVEYESFLRREEGQSSSPPMTVNNTHSHTKNGKKGNNKNWNNQPRNNGQGNGQGTSNKSENPNTNTSKNPNVICQFYGKRGHSARQCYHAKKIMLREHPPTANHTATGTNASPNWLMDSAASHHVTGDLNNLSLHQPYEGPDDIVIGDGTCLNITYIGSSKLSTPTTSFSLSNVLCVPSIKQNLISVFQFCNSNKTSVEFFPSYFVVKDLTTGAHLIRGRSRNNVYEWPTMRKKSMIVQRACVGIKTSFDVWHNRLGHPSSKILKYLVSNKILPIESSRSCSSFFCDSCLCNKSHRLSFGVSSLSSRGPLDLIYTDVWGPSPIQSIDGFSYYVIFVDYFTKYSWLFPMQKKI